MLCVTNVGLIGGATNTLWIDNARIVKGTTTANSVEVSTVDMAGLLALPAAIDVHVHDRYDERHKESWSTLVSAALEGGVATIATMPNSVDPLTRSDQIQPRLEHIGDQPIEYRFWMGTTQDNTTQAKDAMEQDVVCGIKIYLASTTCNLQLTLSRAVREHMQQATSLRKPVAVHAEDEEMLRCNRRRFPEASVRNHCLIRDTEVEVSGVKRAIQFQQQTGCRLHLCHLSAPESVELAKDARDKGACITVETCPQYLYLNQSHLQRPDGAYFKCNPALRSEKQVQRMRELLARPDFIDVVATDHAPHTHADKRRGGYDHIPSGMPGVQTLVPLLLNLVYTGELTWERFIALTSSNPACLLGLEGHGAIAPDCHGDIMFVEPQDEQTLWHSQMKYKCGWTPYARLPVHGAIKAVIVKGVLYDFR